jgi:hypothetical protein
MYIYKETTKAIRQFVIFSNLRSEFMQMKT